VDTCSEHIDVLFQATRIGSLELKNRIVMAPMTRALSPGGVPRQNGRALLPSSYRTYRQPCASAFESCVPGLDLVAVGRALIANPDWARRIRSGSVLKPYSLNLLQTLD
jgi:2,4-dienoyl-CoA reductase-like NADH-dependent reductase (Old Yellow Enzyme family)